MKRLSIIIVNYNAGKYLQDCIASIQSSTLRSHEYEILVVDNNSQDTSRDYLKGISSKKIIRCFFNTENQGFAKANNQAIKVANGKYILLLNPDTKVQKDTLKVLVDYLDSNTDVGIVTCKVSLPDGSIDDASHRGFPTPLRSFFQFTGIAAIFSSSPFFNGYHLGYKDLDQIHEIDSCVGAFMMIRKKVGDSIHWLDEEYFWYGEDLDFCYRVKKEGWKITYNPKTKITHYKGVTSGIKSHSKNISSATQQTKIDATNARFDVMKIFYRKHYQKKYPLFVKYAVLLAIELKRFITISTLS